MQLVAIDMVGYIIWVNVTSPAVAAKAVRWSRPLRPLFLINFPEGRQVRLTSTRLVLTTDQFRDDKNLHYYAHMECREACVKNVNSL